MIRPSESAIKASILLEAPRRGIMLLNAPVGLFVTLGNNPHKVKVGVVGQADTHGVAPYVIKPEDVGKTVGVAFAVETKVPKYGQTPDQVNFGRAWVRHGGIYRVGRDLDALRAVTL